MDNEKYLPELMAEKDSLDPSFQHSLRLLDQEIEKVQKDEDKEDEKFIDVVINKNMKLGQKILIPVKQFPKFNFVGKLLGPRGNSLKRLQEDTLTKMSILGKGSMRDKEKEEELRKSGETKYHHLNEDLHVLIEVFAPPAEAYARMGHALEEIKKFLIPDYNDEIRQAQLQELTYLNGASEDAKVPAARGKSSTRGRGTPAPGPHRCNSGNRNSTVPLGRGGRGPPELGIRSPPWAIAELGIRVALTWCWHWRVLWRSRHSKAPLRSWHRGPLWKALTRSGHWGALWKALTRSGHWGWNRHWAHMTGWRARHINVHWACHIIVWRACHINIRWACHFNIRRACHINVWRACAYWTRERPADGSRIGIGSSPDTG
uniref:K Homology domain-containing protein n=1 Tax=Sinocyclocheilus anshuiensis TaxID=1608454 RepID=A0A671KMQ6_9TELE